MVILGRFGEIAEVKVDIAQGIGSVGVFGCAPAIFFERGSCSVEVTGKGSLEFLERMTTGNVRKKPGSITYCLLLNERAGILSDITVMRRGEQDFFVGVNSNIDINYLRLLAPDNVHVRDITGGTVGLGLFGPKSRELAQSLTRDDLSNEALPYFRLKNIYLGHVPAMLCRLSYVGELGYEIYTTADLALKLWDTLWRAGKKYGLIAAGRGAFNSMRLEKGYRSYGVDMNSEHNPYEAGWPLRSVRVEDIRAPRLSMK